MEILHSWRSLQCVSTKRNPDLDESDLIIAMSRREHYEPMRRMFPTYAERIAYWDVEDTGKMPTDVAFQRIELLVDQLIDDIRLK